VRYFGRKGRLVHALLDWRIGTTPVLHVPDEVARLSRAMDRLHALPRQEMARLSHPPRHTRLFLEFRAPGRCSNVLSTFRQPV
jgi:hypothetical protein